MRTKTATDARVEEGTLSAEMAAAEEILRQIAQLPVPAGLEDRLQMQLQAALRRAPRASGWFSFPRIDGAWLHSATLRVAAAVGIAAVVAGGGWGVVTRTQPAALQGTVAPAPSSVPGFSSAGAIRTPRTLVGPVMETPKAPTAKPVRNSKTKPHHKILSNPEAAREK